METMLKQAEINVMVGKKKMGFYSILTAAGLDEDNSDDAADVSNIKRMYEIAKVATNVVKELAKPAVEPVTKAEVVNPEAKKPETRPVESPKTVKPVVKHVKPATGRLPDNVFDMITRWAKDGALVAGYINPFRLSEGLTKQDYGLLLYRKAVEKAIWKGLEEYKEIDRKAEKLIPIFSKAMWQKRYYREDEVVSAVRRIETGATPEVLSLAFKKACDKRRSK